MLGLLLTACAPRYAGLPPLAPADLWTPLPVQHADVGGIDVAWVDSGGTGTPVVLVHGLSSSMGFWELQVPALAARHRVLALDLPGFGASGRPDAPCTPPWYADLLARWMDVIGLPSASIIGHSLGGQIALTLALTQPERVDRLVLAAPAGFERYGPGEADWLKAYWTEDRALRATEDEVRINFTRLVFNRVDAGVERLIEERVRLGAHPAFAGTSVAVSRSIAGMLDHPVWDRLPEIAVPTLVIFGTEDRMIPNAIFTGGRTATVARQGTARLPRARLELVRGAGHAVHHDAPEAFNALVLGFLP